AAFGIYNLYLACISINKLQGYEDTAKKAAKYSNTAAEQLRQTRATQASGTISVRSSAAAAAVLVSLLSSAYLVVGQSGAKTSLGLVGLNVLALAAAWQHVGGFWSRKA
ncbi:hypothetical protein BUE80_DR013986, partial [Diplocarpon rosae]